jgi:hypothetical protein
MVEVVRNGSLKVALPPADALELFTARGEVKWAPGWAPEYVNPPDGEPVEGGIWLTKDGDTEVIWRVQRYDVAAGVAEYLRVVPGNRVAVVRVQCMADGPHTTAKVQYRITPLGPAGRAWLAELDERAYAAMMQEWERLIGRHLREPAPSRGVLPAGRPT